MNIYKQNRNFISLIRYRLWCSLFMIVAWTLNAIDAILVDGIVAIPEATLVCTIFIVMLLWPLIRHRKLFILIYRKYINKGHSKFYFCLWFLVGWIDKIVKEGELNSSAFRLSFESYSLYDYIWLVIYILFLMWIIFYADMSNWHRLISPGSVILLILKSLYVKQLFPKFH